MVSSPAKPAPKATTRAAARTIAKTAAASSSSSLAEGTGRTGKAKAFDAINQLPPPLPVRAKAPVRLAATKACIWGALPQVQPLLEQRARDFDLKHASASAAASHDSEEYQCQTRPERNTINLRTRDPFHTEIYFKCKPTTVLAKLFTAYVFRTNQHHHDVAFSVGDRQLDGTETPLELGLEDGDVIYVTHV